MDNFDFKIGKGRVTSTKDTERSGVISVSFDNGKTSLPVIYTSPYFNTHTAGVLAIPSINSEVLVANKGNKYYYISTIVALPESNGAVVKEEGGPAPVIGEKRAYDTSSMPACMTFKDATGAGLKIVNYRVQKKPVAWETTLRSTQGHKLVLSDSPDKDCVMLKNKDGDGMTITSNRNTVHSDNSIVTYSKSTQRCIVLNGEYTVRVVDGRDLTLENGSTGANKLYYRPVLNPADANYLAKPWEQYGNVNLISRTKDINIYTGADNMAQPMGNEGGDVLISTLTGLVQINSKGDVKIFSNASSVTVQANNDLNLVSLTGDVNIQATLGKVNILSYEDTNITAGTAFNAQGATETNLGYAGRPLNLNRSGGPPATPDPVVPEIPKINSYGR